MTGIQFLTDEKGRKVPVQIDLRKHGAHWEDFYDGLISDRRRKEKGVPFKTVKDILIKRRRLRDQIFHRHHTVRAMGAIVYPGSERTRRRPAR